jgi:hypothetical protein
MNPEVEHPIRWGLGSCRAVHPCRPHCECGRILVLATELPKVVETGGIQFQYAMIELGVLTAMTLSLIGCLVMLRKRALGAVAERA